MKRFVKAIGIFLFGALILAFSANSQGATLVYTPQSMEITLAAGSEGTIPYAVSVQNGSGSYYLWFVNSVGDGNLPLGWFSASPATTFLSNFTPSGYSELHIKVPEGTEPGDYSGTLFSRGMPVHGTTDPGQGILVKVTVPSDCDQPPSFQFTGFGPDTLWPPNGKMRDIAVSGRVEMQTDCSLMDVGYSLDDEYGVYTAMGNFSVAADGGFTAYIPVEASRNGNDFDGRHYTITLFAQNEAGLGSSPPYNVVVPHDQRAK
jgi:hypothetical protein